MGRRIRSVSAALLLLCMAMVFLPVSGCSFPAGEISGTDLDGHTVTYGMSREEVEEILGTGEKLLGTIYTYGSGWSIGYRDGRVVCISLRGIAGQQVRLPRTCYSSGLFGWLTQEITVGKTTVEDLAVVLGDPSAAEGDTRLIYCYTDSGSGRCRLVDDIGGIGDEDAMDAIALTVICSGDGTICEAQVSDLFFARYNK